MTEASRATGEASTGVLGAARELAVQSEQLRGDVDRFIAQVRAA